MLARVPTATDIATGQTHPQCLFHATPHASQMIGKRGCGNVGSGFQKGGPRISVARRVAAADTRAAPISLPVPFNHMTTGTGTGGWPRSQETLAGTTTSIGATN